MDEGRYYRLVGRRLHKIRVKQGITLRDLEIKTGVSNSFLSQIENGSPCALYKLAVIAAYLGTTLEAITKKAERRLLRSIEQGRSIANPSEEDTV